MVDKANHKFIKQKDGVYRTSLSLPSKIHREHLPIKEFNNAVFPASLGPKTKHW